MASFTETFANSVGIRLPETVEDFPTNFIPIPEKFIVINSSGDYDSFKYDHYPCVVRMIRNKISDLPILQIGNKEDPLIDGCLDFRGITLRQAGFVIENSLLLVSGDSLYLHLAGQKNIPFVGLFSVTPVQSSIPYYKDKYIVLESCRDGKKPSYSAVENPKTINLIKPEDVANAIGKFLDFSVNIETFRIGKLYGKNQIDYIPDSPPPNIPKGVPSACRMDIFYNPKFLVHYLNLYTGNIITNHPIPIEILQQNRDKINSIVYFLDFNPSINFVKDIIKLGIKLQLVTTKTGNKLKEIKYNFCEFGHILQKNTPDKSKLDNSYYFDTNRIYFGKGKIYPTLYHYKQDITLTSLPQFGESLESSDIDECLDNLIIYRTYAEKKERNK